MSKVIEYMKLKEEKESIEERMNEIKDFLIQHQAELQSLYETEEFVNNAESMGLTEVPIVVNQTKGQVASEVFNDINDETILLEFAQKVWKPSVPKFRVAMKKHPELEKYYIEKAITYIKTTSLETIRKKLSAKLNKETDHIDALLEEL